MATLSLEDMDARITPALALNALSRHSGQGNGVTAARLVIEILGRTSERDERDLREAIVRLRLEGHHVCAHPTHGYYIASDPHELEETIEFLYARAMTSLTQIAAMKRVALPDLRGQLRLRT